MPFYIRAGKCMPVTSTEVVVEFRRPPREVFGELVPSLSSHLRLRLSPDVIIGLGMRVKVAGERMAGEDVELIVTRQPGEAMTPYERLLGDALRGDPGLFGRPGCDRGAMGHRRSDTRRQPRRCMTIPAAPGVRARPRDWSKATTAGSIHGIEHAALDLRAHGLRAVRRGWRLGGTAHWRRRTLRRGRLRLILRRWCLTLLR